MNNLEVLNYGNKLLKNSNISSYKLDSELLLAKVLNFTREKLLIQAYVGVFLVSMVLWFLDQFYCSYTKSYQLHALWHVGTSLSILLGCLTLI